MSDFGCPFAYLQNMVDADALPVEVLNALKENYCDEEGAKDTWDLVEKAELEEAQEEIRELKDKLIEKSTSYLTKCEVDLLKTKKVYALEEENKKLLKEISRLEDRAVADYDTRMKEYKQLKEELEQYKEELEEAHHQYDLLKEENKELKLERERDTIAEVRSARDRALSENKKLKAKFEKFKEVLTQE